MRTRAEAGELDDPELLAVTLDDAAGGHRNGDSLTLDADPPGGVAPGTEHAQLHAGARGSLYAAGRDVRVDPGQRLAVHLDYQVAALDAGLFGGGALEDAQHLEAAPVLLHVHAHALELPAHRFVEAGGLLGSQVVRERIVQRLHDSFQGGVLQRLLVDPLVEVLLDRIDDLLAAPGPLPRGHPGSGRGRSGWPQPDADEQRENGAQERHECRTGRGHGPMRLVAGRKRP